MTEEYYSILGAISDGEKNWGLGSSLDVRGFSSNSFTFRTVDGVRIAREKVHVSFNETMENGEAEDTMFIPGPAALLFAYRNQCYKIANSIPGLGLCEVEFFPDHYSPGKKGLEPDICMLIPELELEVKITQSTPAKDIEIISKGIKLIGFLKDPRKSILNLEGLSTCARSPTVGGIFTNVYSTSSLKVLKDLGFCNIDTQPLW